MSKKVRLWILIPSLFFTLPMVGYLMSFNFLLGAAIYVTQLGTSIGLLRDWYKHTPEKEDNDYN